jgi:4-amino-4-deoxy-L-arabinose transferase-like glycosyltransferase
VSGRGLTGSLLVTSRNCEWVPWLPHSARTGRIRSLRCVPDSYNPQSVNLNPLLRRLATDRALAYWVLCAIVLFGLAIRLFLSWQWNNNHPNSAARLLGDESNYDDIAREMLQGYGVTWPGRAPLYPLWLAGVYWFSGCSYNAVPYAQSLLGVATIVLTFELGRRVFGLPAGLLAACAVAIDVALIRHGMVLMTEILYTPIILLSVITLWDAMDGRQNWRFALGGALIGISNLIRPTLFLFPFAVAIVLWIRLGRRSALRSGAVFVAAAYLVITPWMVRNYLRYSAVFPIATSVAVLWQGSPEYYHLLRDQGYTYMRVWKEVIYGPLGEGHSPLTIEGDRWWTRRALHSIAAEPLVYLKYFVEKLGTYWVGDPNADWANSYVFNYRIMAFYFGPQYAAVLMVARVMPVFALLSCLILRRQWRLLLPVYSLLSYCTLLHAATHAEVRLSEPFHPLLLILIGGAV